MLKPLIGVPGSFYEADCDADVLTNFNGESWLLVPTDDLRLYEIDEKQLRILSRRVNARFPMRRRSRAESEE